jgi:hypothetical protein
VVVRIEPGSSLARAVVWVNEHVGELEAAAKNARWRGMLALAERYAAAARALSEQVNEAARQTPEGEA